ncbi:hypothetical protein LWI28_026947 [Acer negundo]|uniref:Uncharacterized protein n=1 Tax=Acer negundo TaxID=4023 RepID=A0AAD5JQQ2_ACENE|nr:hypothetical protein LWI28_026947 [Acer negundo]
MPPFAKQVGNSYMDIPVAPAFGAALPPAVKRQYLSMVLNFSPLSLEEEEEEEEEEDYDEEEVSTARTYGNYGCDSPDSSSSYGTESQKNKSSSSKLKSAGSSSNCDKAWSWEFEELVLLSSHGRYYEDNNNRVISNLELMVCSCISLDFEYALPTMIG